MPNFISDFFENRGWLKIPQYVSGRFQVAGKNIDPYEFTLTEFKSKVSSDYAAITVRITDVHSTSSGSGGVLLTGGSVWTLESAQIYQSTFATALTNFPAATYPGLRIQCGDVAPLLESNGARYKPRGTQGYLFNEVNGTIASPSKSLGDNSGVLPQLFSLSKPTIPGGLIQPGDMLWFHFDVNRHGTGAMTLVLCLGTTANVLTDAVIWSSGIATTDLAKVSGLCKVEVGANTSMSTNNTASIQSTGGSGSGSRTSVTANLNFAVDQTLKMGLSGKATNAETLDLLQLSCLWVAA